MPNQNFIHSVLNTTFSGAGPDIKRSVIIENQKDTTMSFVDGANNAYFGHCTVGSTFQG